VLPDELIPPSVREYWRLDCGSWEIVVRVWWAVEQTKGIVFDPESTSPQVTR
jgi:hypothetical protein